MLLSVIIPTFNEELTIVKTLDAIARLVNVDEVVIVDGGSTDRTIELIENHSIKKPLKVVRTDEANRGKQLDEGVRQASHELLWFLHADTRPIQGCAREIKKYLKYDEVVGGNFKVLFDGGSRAARFMMWLHPQLQSIGLVYGDSAIFTRRDVYDKVGGFKPLPVLEDVDFVKRIRRKGDFRFLTQAVTTSSRRFKDRGFLFTFLKWSFVQSLFWIGIPAQTVARVFWKQ